MNLRTDTREIFASRSVRVAFGIVCVLVLSLLIFHAGVSVGERRAQLRPDSQQKPPFGVLGVPLPHGFIPDGHGAVGTITATHLPSAITLEERDGAIKNVHIETETRVLYSPGVTTTPLSVGQLVVVIGEPAEATDTVQGIDARIIRILGTISSTAPQQ